jgi:hypothetical protein
MKLWSDYEGRTIAEAYPLKKLVRPEGRSAFFLTTNGTGTPALVRIIEAHFDESDILQRWKTVSEIGQENLITMRKFGQTELDGTPLVYAVMEPTDISLAELLQNRTLTSEESRELAYSLISALESLHQRGLIHGQVDPENILATSDAIKLRSDCVREVSTHPDSDGPTLEELKAQDAQALAVVLLQGLTGRTSLQGSATLLPSPFDGIIRNGLSGRWGLAEMSAALGPKPKPALVPEPVKPAAPAPVAATPAATPTPVPATPAVASVAAPNEAVASRIESAQTPVAPARTAPAPAPTQENLFIPSATAVSPVPPARPTPVAAKLDAATSAKAVAESLAQSSATGTTPIPHTPAHAPDVRHRIVRPVVEQEPNRTKMWAAIAAAVLVLLILGWRMMRSEPANATGAKPVSTLADPSAATSTPAIAKPTANRYSNGKASAVRPAPSTSASATVARNTTPAPVVTGGAGAKTIWRVVAYTYNRQDQAQQKADSIKSQHPGLTPEVFSPSGRAPYLVTVGGPMSHDAAESFRNKARSQGLPHDVYAQNYSH